MQERGHSELLKGRLGAVSGENGGQEESELLITRAEADVAGWCPCLGARTGVSWQLEVISSGGVCAYLYGQEPRSTLFKCKMLSSYWQP